MSVEFAGGLTAETPLPPRSLVRATFVTTGYAIGQDRAEILRSAYGKLSNSLGASGLGYLASPLAVAPGAEAMTVDIRRTITGSPTAGAAASILANLVGNLGPDVVELSRLAAVQAGEGASNAEQDRTGQSGKAESVPSWWETILTRAQSIGSWFLWVLVLVAVIAVILFLR